MKETPILSHVIIRAMGILLTASAVLLLCFLVYIIPQLYWNWAYPVPTFLHHMRAWHQNYQLIQVISPENWIFLFFLFWIVVFFVIAKILNNWLEKQQEALQSLFRSPDGRDKRSYKPVISLFLQILTCIVLLSLLFWGIIVI